VSLAAVILADLPWPYNDRKETRRDNPGRAELAMSTLPLFGNQLEEDSTP